MSIRDNRRLVRASPQRHGFTKGSTVVAGTTRLTWLMRRLSRMYWREVPYRAASVGRALLQSRGLMTANGASLRVDQPRHGMPWCRVPASTAATAGYADVLVQADRLLAGRLEAFGR